MRWHHRTCTFCEASCGIRVGVAENRIAAIEPDDDDPLSQGHICAKAFALKYLHEDPERLRRPQLRVGRRWREVSWAEAFDVAGARLGQLQRQHGRDAVALFLGNPVGQNFGTGTYSQMFAMALGTRNYFTSCSLDQNPAHAAAFSLFGNVAALGVPDINRTDCFVAFGANPVVSNGSLMTAPGFKRRARALGRRGGTLVVVDPRRTKTAELADHHLAIRPGTDAWLLGWLVSEVLERAPQRCHPAVQKGGTEVLREALAPLELDEVAARTGLERDAIEVLLRTLLDARRPVVYGRIGISHQRHASLCSWLLVLLNIVIGALDRTGGLMFPTPAVDLARFAGPLGRTGGRDRWRSSVRAVPEFNGELPAGVFAEEILDADDDHRIRGLVSLGANIARCVPDSSQVERALGALKFFVAIDFYRNATTEHADLILPPTTPAQQSNYPGIPYALAVRNVARYSAPTLSAAEDELADWEILKRLQTALLRARGRRAHALGLVSRAIQAAASPDRILAGALRAGPHDITFDDLRDAPSGVDLGPLEPRLERVMYRRPDGIRVDDPLFLSELRELCRAPAPSSVFELVGRRHPRSNNSWFQRYDKLGRGRERATAQIHPDDGADLGLRDHDRVAIRRGTTTIEALVVLTDEVRRGVVCLPHGWDTPGPDGERLGPNYNELSAGELDPICGNAVFTGIEVELIPRQ